MIAQLIAALILVESSGNATAVGDGGRALGCLQIHRCVITDVNRRYKTDFKHADALDIDKAILICQMYLEMYAPPGATMEQLARIWNGGPNGYKKKCTKAYWLKVRRCLG